MMSDPLSWRQLPRDEAPDYVAAIRLTADAAEAATLAARYIFDEFIAYYLESRQIPSRAKEAFERRDPGQSLLLSRRRLSIYSESIRDVAAGIKDAFPRAIEDEEIWRRIEAIYLPLIQGRYEEDLGIAYLHSVHRIVYQDEWKPVDYSFGEPAATAEGPAKVYRDFPGGARVLPATILDILKAPDFTVPFQDLEGDAALAAARVNRNLGFDGSDPEAIRAIQVIDAGFYRNRGAYLVGRIVRKDWTVTPLILSLDNHTRGIFVDAVLTSEADTHNIFSSTLANFHVTDRHYHELAVFLHSIMPQRPLGLHYSTIGFNHVGKVAVMDELRDELNRHDEVFDLAPGFPGTVAIGFTAPSSRYVLKVIRNEPTEQYKWGAFEGIESVLHKYRRVHEINRTGSMLDNIIYYNVKLDRDWFAEDLLRDLLGHADETVSAQEDYLVFRHLIVQPKMIPLPIFLETAAPEDAETAVVNLGHCIRNNAAANIFNKDLDGRNYGVSRFLKVYLFDYDALEPFTDVKVRTNTDRVDGEEEIPEWFFEDGVIFLPEEIEAGLRIDDRNLRRRFREAHGDLLTTDYWEGVQRALLQGRVPRLRVYPEETRLRARRTDFSRV